MLSGGSCRLRPSVCREGTSQPGVVGDIIAKYHTPVSTRTVGRRVLDENSELRLTERHFANFIPSTAQKKFTTKRCVVCTKNKRRRESRYMCPTCNVPLCIVPCFEIYHTKKHFQKMYCIQNVFFYITIFVFGRIFLFLNLYLTFK